MDRFLEELPMGLGMALANNPVAMNYFMGKTGDKKVYLIIRICIDFSRCFCYNLS